MTQTCAGAIHSPALLQRSGIGPAAVLPGLGVPVVADRPAVMPEAPRANAHLTAVAIAERMADRCAVGLAEREGALL